MGDRWRPTTGEEWFRTTDKRLDAVERRWGGGGGDVVNAVPRYRGTVANSAALPSTGNTANDAFLAADTGHLWVRNSANTAWVDAGQWTGPKGDKGDKGDTGNTGATGATGPANSLAIGTVTTGAAGSSAAASITGTPPSQTLSLTIPKGDKGDQGIQGVPGSPTAYTALGTSDLDTILSAGYYEQTTGSNGTLARHYPIDTTAGLLQVFANGNHTTQMFYARGDAVNLGRVFVRSKYSTSAFLSWHELTDFSLPGATYYSGPASTALTGAVLSWQNVMTNVYPAQPYDMVLDIFLTAICKSSTGYTMIGTNLSGGVVLAPDEAPDGGAAHSGFTPFTASTVDTAISQTPRRVILPANQTLSVSCYTRRSVASGTQTCNYPIVTVLPVRWV